MSSAAQYLVHLAERGRHHFTTLDAKKALGVSLPAVRASLRRLKAKGEIADPHRGFHVIVPPEYRRLGCLPPAQFVPHLMQHLGEQYYVALLSAAELHGAAHHRPQSFQVMLAKNRRPVECGHVRVQFIARQDLERTPVVEKNTPRGPIRVSSPEATALELVAYPEPAGGLDNVASVLVDLVEAIEPTKLVDAARRCPIAWAQRLGHLLEVTGQSHVAEPLAEYVHEHAVVIAPLLRKKSMTKAPRAMRWRLALNAKIEPDL